MSSNPLYYAEKKQKIIRKFQQKQATFINTIIALTSSLQVELAEIKADLEEIEKEAVGETKEKDV